MGRMIPYFNGVDSYVTIPSFPQVTGDVTIEAIFIPTSLTATYMTIFSKDNASNYDLDVMVRNTDLFEAHTSNTANTGTVTPNVSPTHIAITFSSSGINMYWNGRQIFNNAVATSIAHTVSSAMIGKRTYSSVNWFQGFIQDVKIWNYARTRKEIIRDMYRTLKGNEVGLVGYWKLDEGGGTVAYDSCGTNHGTYNGTFQWLELPDIVRKHESQCSVTEG